MSPDTYLILLEIPKPRREGHPAVPTILNFIAASLKKLYWENGQSDTRINLRLWGYAEVEGQRRELP